MQRDDLIIRIAGEGGQGVVTVGQILQKVIAQSGLHILTESTFGFEIKGSETVFQLRVSPWRILSQGDRIDILVVLNRESYRSHRANLFAGCVMIYDNEEIEPQELEGTIFYSIPMSRVCRSLGNPLSKNMVALGALAQLLLIPADLLRQQIQERFSDEGSTVTRINLEAFEAGLSYMKQQRKRDSYLLKSQPKEGVFLLMNGNEAIGLGALIAGCRFYPFYPITPATTIADWLSKHLPGMGGGVIQGEDPIESLAMAVGASYGGVKAMTATSGPGLDLMQELVGFSSMAEVPIVIVDVQRGGPSNGLPTQQEQGDLFAACFGGHGDVPRIVLAPSDVRDCLYLTIEAFNLAEHYQVPVILLSDASLSRRSETVPRPELTKIRVTQRARYDQSQPHYLRYSNTEDGISPMAIPGQTSGQNIATGLEHTEAGSPCYSPEGHTMMTDKRFKKLEALEDDSLPIEREGPARAEVGIISWGSTQGAVREAMQRFQQMGLDVAALYPKLLWPLPVRSLRSFAKSVKKVVVVEANKQGQFAYMIRSCLQIRLDQIKRYAGIPISPWDIFSKEDL